MWQQLELASDLEFDLRKILNWDRKWSDNYNAGKIKLVLYYLSNSTSAIDMRIDGCVLEENSSFKIFGLSSSSKLDWRSSIVFVAKTDTKKIGALIHAMKFHSPEVALYLCKSTLRSYMKYCCPVWLVLLAAS